MFALLNFSRQLLPFTKIPYLDAAPIPAKNDKGIEITSAHGQDTTRKLNARYIQVAQSEVIKLGTIAKKRATITTVGV